MQRLARSACRDAPIIAAKAANPACRSMPPVVLATTGVAAITLYTSN
jgi:hypothetical protein